MATSVGVLRGHPLPGSSELWAEATCNDILTAVATPETARCINMDMVNCAHLLAENGKASVVRQGLCHMLEMAPDLMITRDCAGWSLLHFAAQNMDGGALAVRILVGHGILEDGGVENGVNVTSDGGETPLMVAASAENDEVIELLMRLGADHAVKAMNGMSAFDYASGPNFLELILRSQSSGPALVPICPRCMPSDARVCMEILSRRAEDIQVTDDDDFCENLGVLSSLPLDIIRWITFLVPIRS